jgi:protein-tyrosine phosphatase
MIPLVDIHCHLLAGLDDGPRDWEQAVEMCRMAWEDGTSAVAATAHQNRRWSEVTPGHIRRATCELTDRLHAEGIPLGIYPCGEVMVGPDLERDFCSGNLQSVADLGRHLLIELPSGTFLDLREMVSNLVDLGIRPILAHPERHPELLHGTNTVEQLILRGCLIQVNACSITQDRLPQLSQSLRDWARRGIIHLIGSDAHSLKSRPPGIAAAYHRLADWAGFAAADRICSANGMAVLEGFPVEVSRPAKTGWFTRS